MDSFLKNLTPSSHPLLTSSSSIVSLPDSRPSIEAYALDHHLVQLNQSLTDFKSEVQSYHQSIYILLEKQIQLQEEMLSCLKSKPRISRINNEKLKLGLKELNQDSLFEEYTL